MLYNLKLEIYRITVEVFILKYRKSLCIYINGSQVIVHSFVHSKLYRNHFSCNNFFSRLEILQKKRLRFVEEKDTKEVDKTIEVVSFQNWKQTLVSCK